MPDKILLHFLILCGIWSQGIIGTSADEEINESSDLLVRQKRVISHIPGEDVKEHIKNVPHVVMIKLFYRITCVGNILSTFVAITAAACVEYEPMHYQVLSRTARTNLRGLFHIVIDIRRYSGHHPGRSRDGLGLVVVNPPFTIGSFSKPIQLHTGPLMPGTLGRVSGWGFNCRVENRGTDYPTYLRTIDVPIISRQDCVNRYHSRVEISDKDICTYHIVRHCGHNDLGAGLVVNGQLAGIFLRSGIVEGHTDNNYPDVFLLLQDVEYNHWITTNIADIQAHYNHSLHQSVSAQHSAV